MQFYLFFLTPIKIATKYRATQEVTPAATVIASVMSVQFILSKFILAIIHARLQEQDSPYLLEVLPIILYLIAVPFIYSSVREEISSQQGGNQDAMDDSVPM